MTSPNAKSYRRDLARTRVLPEKFALIGVSRSVGTAESWRNRLHDTLKSFVGNIATEFDVDHIDEVAWKQLADKMTCVQADLTKPELYEKLRGALEALLLRVRSRARQKRTAWSKHQYRRQVRSRPDVCGSTLEFVAFWLRPGVGAQP